MATATRSLAESKGEAAPLHQIYQQYKLAPDVTRKRMFLETMERVLADTDKVIVDEKAGPAWCRICPCRNSPKGAAGRPRRVSHEPVRSHDWPRSSLGIVAGFLAYLTLFTVDQTQQALVLEFGKPSVRSRTRGYTTKFRFIPECRIFRQAHPRHRHRLTGGHRL